MSRGKRVSHIPHPSCHSYSTRIHRRNNSSSNSRGRFHLETNDGPSVGSTTKPANRHLLGAGLAARKLLMRGEKSPARSAGEAASAPASLDAATAARAGSESTPATGSRPALDGGPRPRSPIMRLFLVRPSSQTRPADSSVSSRCRFSTTCTSQRNAVRSWSHPNDRNESTFHAKEIGERVESKSIQPKVRSYWIGLVNVELGQSFLRVTGQFGVA